MLTCSVTRSLTRRRVCAQLLMTINAPREFVLSGRDIIKRLMCRGTSDMPETAIRNKYIVNFNNIEYFLEEV